MITSRFLKMASGILVGALISAQPSIVSTKWDRATGKSEIVILDGAQRKIYRDARLFPTGSESWDWNKTGTRHHPGVNIEDIADIMKDADTVILTRGVDLVLQVPQDTINYVKNNGKTCYVGQTEEMVVLYNKLISEGKKVAALFHTTC